MFLTAIILTAFGAVGLAVGTHLQHRAVSTVAASGRSGPGHGLGRALRSPLWLLGMAVIVVDTILNVVALGIAPVAIVQPVGSLSLVCAVIISALALGVRVGRGLVTGIAVTVGSVALFVTLSSTFARDARPSEDAVTALSLLLLFLTLIGAIVAYRGTGHLVRVVSAGVLFGTVASAVHVAAGDLIALVTSAPGEAVGGMPDATQAHPPLEASTLWMLVVLIGLASAVGAWLVQTAYASGPPETVLAGLTVIDPLVAVLVGAFLLGEYATVPPMGILALVASAVTACVGIVLIVRHHPGISHRRRTPDRELPVSSADADSVAPVNERS